MPSPEIIERYIPVYPSNQAALASLISVLSPKGVIPLNAIIAVMTAEGTATESITHKAAAPISDLSLYLNLLIMHSLLSGRRF